MATAANYTIEVYDPSGNLMADVSKSAMTRSVRKIRNNSDTITLEFDLDQMRALVAALGTGQTFWDIFYVGRNDIRVTRNNLVVSAGRIAEVTPSISGDVRKVSVIATGWLDLLANRYSGSNDVYTATDAGQIAWSAIATSQALTNGNYGFAQGTIQASVNRDRTYSYKRIKDLIIELSQVINGFDFEFSWDKKFNVYYPKIGVLNQNVTFTYPGNIAELSFKRNGQDIANEIIARGAGTGPDAFVAQADDLASQGKYALRQEFVEYSDISIVNTLQEHANSELLLKANYADVPTLRIVGNQGPQWGDYGIGDIVPIAVTQNFDVFAPVNDLFRIDQMQLDIDENNQEIVTLNMMR